MTFGLGKATIMHLKRRPTKETRSTYLIFFSGFQPFAPWRKYSFLKFVDFEQKWRFPVARTFSYRIIVKMCLIVLKSLDRADQNDSQYEHIRNVAVVNQKNSVAMEIR